MSDIYFWAQLFFIVLFFSLAHFSFLIICSFGTKICILLHFGPKISHSRAIRSILELKLFLDGTCNILDLGRLLVRKNAASWSQHLHAIVCITFTVNWNLIFAWYLFHFGATIWNLHGICYKWNLVQLLSNCFLPWW